MANEQMRFRTEPASETRVPIVPGSAQSATSEMWKQTKVVAAAYVQMMGIRKPGHNGSPHSSPTTYELGPQEPSGTHAGLPMP